MLAAGCVFNAKCLRALCDILIYIGMYMCVSLVERYCAIFYKYFMYLYIQYISYVQWGEFSHHVHVRGNLYLINLDGRLSTVQRGLDSLLKRRWKQTHFIPPRNYGDWVGGGRCGVRVRARAGRGGGPTRV